MKKFLFIFIASAGFSALPPMYQSVRELNSLLADPQLVQILGSSEPIIGVVRTEMGYCVTTLRQSLNVVIHYGGDERLIGPAQYHFEFLEPTARLN